ncbi:hypothetical protein [uncultured Erythrobacter sp.]|uniref:hypothetical protein n=1 Tax=uncultured Erythrobacter sp. TaxID=263913 RepID=UPI002638010E|nr:hypothetical protein [uncultured Erythrobacter sp.]
MFGADTALVFEALQMSAVIGVVTGGIVYVAMRFRRKSKNCRAVDQVAGSNLEQCVRVLERIATDRSIDLAKEIEALRGAQSSVEHKLKESSQ